MTKKTKLLLCAFLAFASPSFAQVVLTATGTITDDDSGDATFAARCAAAEALGGKCETFDTSTAVDNYRYNFGASPGDSGVDGWDNDSSTTLSDLVTWQAGRLRLEENPAGDNPTSWWWNMDPAATTMSHTNSVDHDEYSVQVEVEISQARFDFDMGGSGHKTIDFTHANQNAPGQVLQLSYEYDRRYWGIANTGSNFNDDIGGGDFDQQPGSEYGTCEYIEASDDTPFAGMQTAGCYVIAPDEPVTFNFHFKFNGDDTADVRASACIDGVEVAFLDVINEPLTTAEDGFYGHSAVNLINRNEDHDAYVAGSVHPYNYYDNLIVQPGAGSIDCPGAVTAPSWFTDEPVNRWQEIPGTSAGNLTVVGNANGEAYSGMAVDPSNLWFSGGGHSLQANNAMYRLDLTAETTAWTKVMAGNEDATPCTGGVADCTTNGTGAYDDGSRASDHTYNTHVGVGGDCSYFGTMGSAWLPSNMTFGSSAVWKWCLADIANGESGYTYLGKALPGGLSGTTVEAVAAWDEVNGRIYVVQNEGTNWYINTSTDAITTFSTYSGITNNWPAFAAILPQFDVLVVGTDSNAIKTMPFASPGTWTNRTVTGTFNTGTRQTPMVYSPAANQLLGRMDGDGNSIRYVTIPGTVSGTYAAGTSSAAASGDSPGDPIEDGPYGRFNLVPDFGGSGDDLLLYFPNDDGPVYFQRIDGPRS